MEPSTSRRAGPPPWLMWGSGQTVAVAGNDVPTGGQLCQIDYRRPETWHFLIYGVITRAANIDPGTFLNVDIALTIGLGRTTIPIPNFARLTWGAGPVTLQPNVVRACTSVEFPKENASRLSNNVVEQVTFQNLQATFTAAFVEGGPTAAAEMQLTMFWAPKSHVRPEWFTSEHSHFPGGEAVGR
jgi:hypothetical protein